MLTKSHHPVATLDKEGKRRFRKGMLKVILPAFFMQFSLAFFIFINYFLVVNYMPGTADYSFYHLFIEHQYFTQDIFNNIHNQALQNEIGKSVTNYEAFLKYLAICNNVHFYDAASTVRVAMSLIAPFMYLVSSLPIAVLPGFNMLLSKKISQNNYLMQIKIWQNGFYVSLLVTIISSLILILIGYLVIPSMIDTALQETINASDVHNVTNGLYYYTLINHQLIFLTYNNGIYTNALNTALTYHASTISVQSFSIAQNNLTIANTYSIYYHLVGRNAINWSEIYILITAIFLFLVNIVNSYLNLMRNYGKGILIAIIFISCIIIDIVLDYILIQFADLGMASAAIGNGLAYFACILVLVGQAEYLHHKGVIYVCLRDLWFSNVIVDWITIKELVYLGSAVTIKAIGFMIFNVLFIAEVVLTTAKLFPALGSLFFVSIIGAMSSIFSFFSGPVVNLLPAVSSIVSFNYGIKNYKTIRYVILITVFLVAVYGVIIILIVGYCSPVTNAFLKMFQLYNPHANLLDQKIYACSKKFMVICLAVLPITGMTNMIYTLCSISKRYMWGIGVNVFRTLLVGLIFLYVLASLAQNQIYPIHNETLALTNPMDNENMWLLLWVQSAPALFANTCMFSAIIFFLIFKLEKPKKKISELKLIKYITRQHYVHLFNETKFIN